MTVKNKATLKSDLNSSYPDNTSKQITPQALRTQQVDTIDSPVNLAETTLQAMAGPLDATNLTKAGKEISASNQIFISQLSDFPTPADTSDGNGVAIHLVSGKTYTLNESISTPYSLVWPENYGSAVVNSIGGGVVQFLTKTGSGPLFTDSNLKMGYGDVNGIILSAPDTGGSLVNVASDTPGLVSYMSFTGGTFGFDCDSVGYVGANMSFDIHFSGMIFCGDGIIFEDTESVFIGDASWWNQWKNVAGSKRITVRGNCGRFVISGFEFALDTNEAGFNIEPTSTVLGGSVSSGAVSGTGSPFFAGSKDQTDPSWQFNGVSGIRNSASFAYMNALDQGAAVTTISVIGEAVRVNATYTDDQERFSTDSIGNATYTGLEDVKLGIVLSITGTVATGTKIPFHFHFAKGNTLNTILSFADAGGGQVTATTSLDHGYSNGDIILIEDTANYEGSYTIANVTADTFEITATWVATETGSHYEVLQYTKGSNDYTGGADSSTSWPTLVDFCTNDIIFLVAENITTTGNFLTSDIQLLIT